MILDGSKNVDSEIRGGSAGCPKIGTNFFTLGCTVDVDEEFDLEYSISIKCSNRVFVHSESLHRISSQNRTIVFQSKDTSDDLSDINVEYNNGSKGRNPEITCNRSVSLLTQLSTKMPTTRDKFKENILYINLIIDSLGKILFLNPLPDLESLPALLSKGNLGDLTIRDELIKAIKVPTRNDHDLGWLGV